MRKGVVGRANWAAGRTWSGERGARVVHGGGPQERCERNPRSARSRRKGNERSDGGSVKGTCEIKELARWRDPLRRGGLTMSRSGGSDCAGPRDAAKRGNDGAESRTNGNGWEPDASGRWSLRKMPALEIARAGVDGPRWECTEHGPSCSENRGRVIDTYLLKICWMESSCGWTRDASRADAGSRDWRRETELLICSARRKGEMAGDFSTRCSSRGG
jgi:hypothetical protein